MGAFAFRLEQEDGMRAHPPTLKAALPNWQAWDTIALGRNKMLRVVDVRPATERRNCGLESGPDAAKTD